MLDRVVTVISESGDISLQNVALRTLDPTLPLGIGLFPSTVTPSTFLTQFGGNKMGRRTRCNKIHCKDFASYLHWLSARDIFVVHRLDKPGCFDVIWNFSSHSRDYKMHDRFELVCHG